jgi:hypothetical protein
MSIFFIWYNYRYYISIIIELLPTIEASSVDLEYSELMRIEEMERNSSVHMHWGSIPIAYSVFELPECPRCLLHLGCKSHSHPVC